MFNFYCKYKLESIIKPDQSLWSNKTAKVIRDGANDMFYFDSWKEALKYYCNNRTEFYTTYANPNRKNL